MQLLLLNVTRGTIRKILTNLCAKIAQNCKIASNICMELTRLFKSADQNFLGYLKKSQKKELSLSHILKCLNPYISFPPNGVNLWYFKFSFYNAPSLKDPCRNNTYCMWSSSYFQVWTTQCRVDPARFMQQI